MSGPRLVTVRSTDTVEQVSAKMQTSTAPLAFVTGDDHAFVGIISDWSLRTAVLAGKPRSESIAELIDPKPKRLKADADHRSDLSKASEASIDAMPIFEGAKPVGVAQVDLSKKLRSAIAVVMAGGRGQRLRPLTDKVPKPLLRIGDSTIIERIITSIGAAGVAAVYLSVNYKARVFEQRLKDGASLGVSLSYLKEDKKLDTAGSLSLLPSKPRGPILVTNADIMTRLDYNRLLRRHVLTGADATMAVVMHAAQIPYGVIQTDGDEMLGMQEKPQLSVPCNAGIYVLSPATLRLISKGEAIGMPALLDRIIAKGGSVKVFPVIESWFDIGSPEDFQKVLIEFATGEQH